MFHLSYNYLVCERSGVRAAQQRRLRAKTGLKL